MGTSLFAKCQCGYSTKSIKIGWGRAGAGGNCMWVCYCNDCKILFDTDIYGKIICQDCNGKNVSIYGDNMVSNPGEIKVISWGNRYITNRGYLCPDCQEFTLLFSEGTLLWD